MPRFTGGVIPALVTPLTPSGEVDGAGCARLVEHVLAGGVHAVLALGSTGESATLGHARRYDTMEALRHAVDGRVPFGVGVTESSLVGTLGQVRRALDYGADAVLVAPPCYAPIDQASVFRFYQEVADICSVPVLAYNIPSFTKVRIEPSTVRRLVDSGLVAGVKDSSGDMEYLLQVLMTMEELGRSDVPVYTGIDTLLLPSLVLGATGSISASANVVPRLGVELYEAVMRGDFAAARSLQRRLAKLVLAMRGAPLPTGIKAALAAMDLCHDTPATPLTAWGADEQRTLQETLSTLGVAVRTPAGR